MNNATRAHAKTLCRLTSENESIETPPFNRDLILGARVGRQKRRTRSLGLRTAVIALALRDATRRACQTRFPEIAPTNESCNRLSRSLCLLVRAVLVLFLTGSDATERRANAAKAAV